MIATCSSPDSRNYTVGFKIAQGVPVKEVLENMDELAEGVHTIKIAQALCNNYGLRAPIINFLYKVMYDDLPAVENLHRLMYYRSAADVDFV
jgi:glycerol-3-phosphate dehydrogenase (NAD(P)+)